MANHNNDIEKRLWDAADQLRANSELTAQQYSVPVLGLIFLRYADHKFTEAEKEIAKKQPSGSRRKIGKADYQARGVMFLPDEARYSYLLNLPERANTGKAVNDAMKAIVPIEVIKRKSFNMRTESYILTTPSKCITIIVSNTIQKGKVKVR